jgi:hypothetical protein
MPQQMSIEIDGHFPAAGPRGEQRRGPVFHHERDSMVRETRFSFDDGMNVNFPAPRDSFDDDDLDDFVADGKPAPKTARPSRREPRRAHPDDRRPDRRHLAGGDWQKPTTPEERATGAGGDERGSRMEDRG